MAAAPTGEGLNLHAHSKHRMRGIRGVVEAPGPGDFGEDGGLEVIDTQIAIRRYWCVDCETTCTVLPAEVRIHAEILRPTVALALAVWALHPDRPSAREVRERMFPDRRCVIDGWSQLRHWARCGAELIESDEKLGKAPTPKRRAEKITQICRARGPPGLRDEAPLRRVFAAAKRPK